MPLATPFSALKLNITTNGLGSFPCPWTLPSVGYYRTGTFEEIMDLLWNGYEQHLDVQISINENNFYFWDFSYSASAFINGGSEPQDRVCGMGDGQLLVNRTFDSSVDPELSFIGSSKGFLFLFAVMRTEKLFTDSGVDLWALEWQFRLEGGVGIPSNGDDWRMYAPGELNSPSTLIDTRNLTLEGVANAAEFHALNSDPATWTITSFSLSVGVDKWTYPAP